MSNQISLSDDYMRSDIWRFVFTQFFGENVLSAACKAHVGDQHEGFLAPFFVNAALLKLRYQFAAEITDSLFSLLNERELMGAPLSHEAFLKLTPASLLSKLQESNAPDAPPLQPSLAQIVGDLLHTEITPKQNNIAKKFQEFVSNKQQAAAPASANLPEGTSRPARRWWQGLIPFGRRTL